MAGVSGGMATLVWAGGIKAVEANRDMTKMAATPCRNNAAGSIFAGRRSNSDSSERRVHQRIRCYGTKRAAYGRHLLLAENVACLLSGDRHEEGGARAWLKTGEDGRTVKRRKHIRWRHDLANWAEKHG